MLASSLVALMLAGTVIALPPKWQGLAKVYSSCKVPNYVALTFVSNRAFQTNYTIYHSFLTYRMMDHIIICMFLIVLSSQNAM